MPGVRSDRSAGLPAAIEGKRIKVAEPEVAVEPSRECRCLVLELRGEVAVAEGGENTREAALGRVGVALHFDQGDWWHTQAPVEVTDGIARILPALVDQASRRAPLVAYVAAV